MTVGRLTLAVAPDAPVAAGNGRLIVVSHGSGGSPWVHADLARQLVAAGFVVAFPEHRADNWQDRSRPGPQSWAQRPAEVSRAIDAVAADPRFGAMLRLDRVGMYGMSAGGHTALSLAGGRSSEASFREHCAAHLAEDFQFCVGLATKLTGGWADGLKQAVARAVLGAWFRNETPVVHTDPRIAAIVAAVPAAADFDMESLARPRVPLALVTAAQDRWLIPRLHADRVLAACTNCERLVDLPDGGHGALLSPLPPAIDGLAGEMLNDPAGYDRAAGTARVNERVTSWLSARLR